MIYLDNAATTFPKPRGMMEAMHSCIEHYCGNPGRSGHKMSMKTSEGIFKTRMGLCELFGIEDGERILFTLNATESLNLAIKGVLCQGDHVITTAMEHNSVLRPLKELEKYGIEVTVMPCAKDGSLQAGLIEKQVKQNTKLIICTWASNVTGTIMPIKEISDIAKRHGVLFLLDASQGAGILDIDLQECNIDMMAAPGHKSLLGPQGTGILYVKEGTTLRHLKHGGTGTLSQVLDQPFDFPDGYEAGTVNSPGIIGLGAAVSYINKVGRKSIKEHEDAMLCMLDKELRNMPNLTMYGPQNPKDKTAIVTFNVKGKGCEEVASTLNNEYDIAVRGGYHCSPLAHKTIGTFECGAVRMSVGAFTTKQEIRRTVEAVYKIQK